MSLLCRASTRARLLSLPTRHVRCITDARPFQAGDHVLLRPTKDRNASPTLTKPLRPGQRLDTHRGIIRHDDLIGKRARDVVKTSGGKLGAAEYRLHEVRLEEYVRLTKRLVTPLYPQDAQLIVGLLDLHPEPPRWGEDAHRCPKLEILEAGTGHGALTLYLSRAIHAANPLPPPPADPGNDDQAENAGLELWKGTRRAVVHSIEVSAKYSAHAEKVVNGFRHGIYSHNVDFHVGNVSEWTRDLLESRENESCLSHAFLDLPGTEQHLAIVASALKTDGTLIVFCPSITQIMACLSTVKEDSIPLELEKVIELGVNGGTGGREWDVRAVRPRAAAKAMPQVPKPDESDGEIEARADGVVEPDGSERVKQGSDTDDAWKMVCRPKVGEAIVGGGFLGVFKKKRDSF